MSEVEIDDEDDKPSKLNHTYICKVLRDRLTFYQSADGWPYVDAIVGGKRVACIDVNGPQVEAIVYQVAAEIEPDGIPTTNVIKNVVAWVRANCRAAPKFPIEHRVNMVGHKLVYDTGRDDMFVEWEGGAWAEKPGLHRFLRGNAALPQVQAVRTTKKLVDAIQPFINASRSDVVLCAAWLLGCFKVGGPYPVLVINGEQGSAKSTTTRFLRSIVDPHALDLRDPLTREGDYLPLLKNSWVLAFDNVSRVNEKFGDMICRIATKTTFATRELYSNGNEVGLSVTRPIILNGIPSLNSRSDLVDRMVQVRLNPIDRSRRLDDDTYWHRVRAAMPEILGALYDAVAHALVEYELTELPYAHRMANFMKWAVAGLGDEFLRAYDAAVKQSKQIAIESNPFTQAIVSLMAEVPQWHGTMTELDVALVKWKPHGYKFWPEADNARANALMRAKPDLRVACIEVYLTGRHPQTRRSQYMIKRTAEWGHLEFSSEVSVSEG